MAWGCWRQTLLKSLYQIAQLLKYWTIILTENLIWLWGASFSALVSVLNTSGCITPVLPRKTASKQKTSTRLCIWLAEWNTQMYLSWSVLTKNSRNYTSDEIYWDGSCILIIIIIMNCSQMLSTNVVYITLFLFFAITKKCLTTRHKIREEQRPAIRRQRKGDSFTIKKASLAEVATSHHTRIHGEYIDAIFCWVCTLQKLLFCVSKQDFDKLLCYTW